jgi:hypothetical protein
VRSAGANLDLGSSTFGLRSGMRGDSRSLPLRSDSSSLHKSQPEEETAAAAVWASLRFRAGG